MCLLACSRAQTQQKAEFYVQRWETQIGDGKLAVRFCGMIPTQQTRSRIWPLLWVGKLTYWLMLWQFRVELKSLVKWLAGLSMENLPLTYNKGTLHRKMQVKPQALWEKIDNLDGLWTVTVIVVQVHLVVLPAVQMRNMTDVAVVMKHYITDSLPPQPEEQGLLMWNKPCGTAWFNWEKITGLLPGLSQTQKVNLQWVH